ncbi:putative transposable element [Pseudoloma neurophilia]|uniref:Putative transposable element n=1 Tax=Pseudoloma neurophilia TaxID=146866 RepID=A0A0R0LZR4_9MICR|nr:putative transposable element [Pseudoloma neurophilia]
MSANGVGRLVFITGNVNSGKYINILANNLFQSADLMNLDEFIFQQDGASVHAGKVVERWFEKKGVSVLEWPSQSPDLNPIEHLWTYIKREVAKKKFETLNDLQACIISVWEKVPKELCEKLVMSMKRRAQAVFVANGSHTKY